MKKIILLQTLALSILVFGFSTFGYADSATIDIKVNCQLSHSVYSKEGYFKGFSEIKRMNPLSGLKYKSEATTEIQDITAKVIVEKLCTGDGTCIDDTYIVSGTLSKGKMSILSVATVDSKNLYQKILFLSLDQLQDENLDQLQDEDLDDYKRESSATLTCTLGEIVAEKN